MIFFSRKKHASDIDLSWLGADMHSHLVPGIDDGSRDLEDSLAMIRGLAALGYRKLITTPHVLGRFSYQRLMDDMSHLYYDLLKKKKK